MSDMNPTKVAILGASGYSGAQLVRILLGHDAVELACVTSRSEAGRCLADVFPRFKGVGGADSLDFIKELFLEGSPELARSQPVQMEGQGVDVRFFIERSIIIISFFERQLAVRADDVGSSCR